MDAYTVDQLVWLKRPSGWHPCCYVSRAPGGRHIVSEAFGSTSINYGCDDKDLSDCTVEPAAFDLFDMDLESLAPAPDIVDLTASSPRPPPAIIDLSCSSPIVINLVTDGLEALEQPMAVGQQVDVEHNGTWHAVRVVKVDSACGMYDVEYGPGVFELGVTADRFRAQ
jgi:hypothetical protein